MTKSITFVMLMALFLLSACAAPAPSTPAPTPTPIPKSHIYTHGIIEVGGDGEPIVLINNPDATNPTYADLLAFIKKDRTDEYSYIFGPPKVAYVCSDFAEDVHNNAEAAGIRAAWVGIDIDGKTEGHALNAFQTTDLGLVYIDCTGVGLWRWLPSKGNSWDKRARVEIGEQYVVKEIDNAKAEFNFSVSIEGYLKETSPKAPGDEEYRERMSEIIEWLRIYDVKELGRGWIQDWMREHEAELYRCGREMEPVETASDARSIYSGTNLLVKYSAMCRWRLYVDCVEIPWFQPQMEVVEVDGMPVEWKVSGGFYGFAPLGIVKDIHIHW